jgi:predicted HAD superfamily Cof-like phosphohydrolase
MKAEWQESTLLAQVHQSVKQQQDEDNMTNPFRDQQKFMTACDQSVDDINKEQYKLYLDLMEEEWRELKAALVMEDRVEQLDALLDFIVVTIGAIHSGGFDGEGGWKEVMRTNLAKIDKETGKVRKREDGKVLKPVGWTPPDLTPFVKK